VSGGNGSAGKMTGELERHSEAGFGVGGMVEKMTIGRSEEDVRRSTLCR